MVSLRRLRCWLLHRRSYREYQETRYDPCTMHCAECDLHWWPERHGRRVRRS
jgi:hypothetical protein